MRFKDFLTEKTEKHGVLAFGRMNPVTVGHEKLVNKVQDIAKTVGGSAHIVVSHSQDTKKNPLTAEQKVKHAKRAFPGVNVSASDSSAPNFLAQASKLHKQGITHLHMVGGADRVDEFHKLLHKYNGVKGPHGHFNFKHITVHSAGDRDPDAEGVEGMSASKMREHASKGNFKEFRKGVPSRMNDSHAKEMYNDVRQGMGLKEDIDEEFEQFLTEGVHDKGIFKAVFLFGGPGSGKDYVLSRTLDGHGLTEINSDKAFEFLMDKENLDMRMPENEKERRDVVRGRAKNVTELRQRLALFGRNGIIVNGTGDDVEKITKIKERLENLGYETSGIMVNTDDEVSKQRNVERGQRGGRTVPEEIRKEKWDGVQAARPSYAKMFGDNYKEFDNSNDLRTADPKIVQAKEKELMDLYKGVQKFVSKPPKNPNAKLWVASELEKKDTLKIDPKKEVAPHEGSKASEQAREMGLTYFGFGRYGKNGKVTHRSVHDKLVEVQPQKQDDVRIPVTGSSMSKVKKKIDEEFEEMLSESVTVSVTADTPEEINQMFSQMFNSSTSIEQEESFMSGKDAENMLLLGTKKSVTEIKDNNITLSNDDVAQILEKKNDKYITDKQGKPRLFMLRSVAAKEAHTKNGTVYVNNKTKQGGYIVKLNQENQNEFMGNVSKSIFNESVFREERGTEKGRTSFTDYRERMLSEHAELTTGQEYARGSGVETNAYEEVPESPAKITLSKIRAKAKKNEVKESIDKGTEPGVSMAGSGESIGRDMGEKIKKKTGKASQVTEEEELDEMSGANMDTRQIHQHLKKHGWQMTRTSGSHDVYTHEKAKHNIAVPRHKQLKAPLVLGILKASKQLNELTGDETTASIGDQKEDELKKKGISLTSFKKRNYV
jgi:predicted RNA binding protein YcfA (HicA-like mRNA interferase family)